MGTLPSMIPLLHMAQDVVPSFAACNVFIKLADAKLHTHMHTGE